MKCEPNGGFCDEEDGVFGGCCCCWDGSGAGRRDGDWVSEVDAAGADGLWNNFLMSGFCNLGPEEVVEGVADVEVDAVRPGEEVVDGVATEGPAERDADIDGFPLMWVDVVAAGTLPKDFTTLSLMGFGAAGDEDIGADASSIEPKVTEEPGR